MRRRRRRSAFAKDHPERRYIVIGAAVIAVLGAFWFLMRQADVHAPQPHEIRIELPDAFKD
ncbi:MAG TPA: hypothetical protein VG841_11995 [Caulobacterales bacterium]|nr:hypothetical protein [Caulobacterales bacterium]